MKDEEVDKGCYSWRTPTPFKHMKLTVRTDGWLQLPNTLMNMSRGLHVSTTLKILVKLLIDLTVPLQITTEPSLIFWKHFMQSITKLQRNSSTNFWGVSVEIFEVNSEDRMQFSTKILIANLYLLYWTRIQAQFVQISQNRSGITQQQPAEFICKHVFQSMDTHWNGFLGNAT